MKIFFIAMLACVSLFAQKEHENWWEDNLEAQVSYDVFAKWLGDVDAVSRVAMRSHVKKMKYQTMLDVPCGLGIDYMGLKKDSMPIQYTGLDVTPKLVNQGLQAGIPVMLGSIEKIPFADNHFELCYARHILEHLDYYETALSELIRTASKEVMVVFFLKPRAHKDDRIVPSMDHGGLLYHNKYNKPKIEKFLRANRKVKKIEWEKIGGHEIILHVYLK